MKTTDYPPRETGGCLIWILILLFIASFICKSQPKIDLRLSQTERNIITTTCAAGSIYTVLKPGCTKSSQIQVGVFSLLGVLAQVVKTPDNIEINSSGINFKIKMDKKYGKCKKVDYKRLK